MTRTGTCPPPEYLPPPTLVVAHDLMIPYFELAKAARFRGGGCVGGAKNEDGVTNDVVSHP